MCSVVLLIVLCCGCSITNKESQSTGFDLNFASSSDEWLTYGHDYGNQRFSPLTEINNGNVTNLVPAYVFQTSIVGPFETSPIVADGVMYITTANDGVFAIDAETGKLKWQRLPLSGHFRQCCGPVNRGPAISQQLVIIGQLDNKVIALNRRTGALQWQVQLANNADGYSITMAPIVYRDSVLVGLGGGDLGIRGSISSLSLMNGKLKWRWYATDPEHWSRSSSTSGNHEGGWARHALVFAQPRDAVPWKRGGGGIWTTPAIDPDHNTVFVTTGNPWPDLNGDSRPGNNLFTDCIVALDASTGRMRWYFQEIAHDTMDLDAASPPVLFDTVDAMGRRVSALGEVGKTGRVYILNRTSGKLIRQSPDLAQTDITSAGKRGWAGGSSWSPMSYDATLGYVVVTASQHLKPKSVATPNVGELLREWRHIYSSVTAVSVATGRVAWQDEFDGGLVGGTSSTAGGITFVGEGDGNFDALETSTGARLWQFQTGAGVNAPPVIFRVRNTEYVAVASGGNLQLGTPLGDALFVFKLH